jgi:hypothetical protein
MQIWTGCSNTIPLAAISAPPEVTQLPELMDMRHADLAVPALAQSIQWSSNILQDVSVATIQEPPPADQISHDLRVLEHQVCMARTEMSLPATTFPARRSGRALWSKLHSSPTLDDTLHPAAREPQEMKFRVWLQPLDDAPGHRLPAMDWRPYPMAAQQDPTSLTPPLAVQNPEMYAPQAEHFAAAGLVPRDSADLSQPCALVPTETEYTVYPAFRRLPHPAISLF